MHDFDSINEMDSSDSATDFEHALKSHRKRRKKVQSQKEKEKMPFDVENIVIMSQKQENGKLAKLIRLQSVYRSKEKNVILHQRHQPITNKHRRNSL